MEDTYEAVERVIQSRDPQQHKTALAAVANDVYLKSGFIKYILTEQTDTNMYTKTTEVLSNINNLLETANAELNSVVQTIIEFESLIDSLGNERDELMCARFNSNYLSESIQTIIELLRRLISCLEPLKSPFLSLKFDVRSDLNRQNSLLSGINVPTQVVDDVVEIQAQLWIADKLLGQCSEAADGIVDKVSDFSNDTDTEVFNLESTLAEF